MQQEILRGVDRVEKEIWFGMASDSERSRPLEYQASDRKIGHQEKL